MPEIDIAGANRPTSGIIPTHLKNALRRKADSIPPYFLYAAGLTVQDLFKIRENVPVTWDEYAELNMKVLKAESMYVESRLPFNQPALATSNETKIPTWLPIAIGVVIFLLIIVIVLRRT